MHMCRRRICKLYKYREHGVHDVHSTVDAPPWRRLITSDRGSGDCPTIVWRRASCQMLKLTPPERTDARGSSDARADRAPSAARYGARSNGISVTVSAEAVGSWIRRLSHHRVSSGERSGAQTHPGRPYRRAWKLRCTRRRSARRRSVWRSK